MTAAKNVVRYDSNSHIAGYYRNLVKKGMSPLEATKRVARALVRVIYRRLSALPVQASETKASGDQERGESTMASGLTRGGLCHMSDIPPSSPANNIERGTSRVKNEAMRKGRTTNRSKIFKKIS